VLDELFKGAHTDAPAAAGAKPAEKKLVAA
jgi:hypothetical protein